MSRGKHLSLEEARRSGQLDRYAKEHPATGDRDRFNALLRKMTSGKKPPATGKEGEDASED